MDNSARSQRTREAAIEAALTIITRDGPTKLTIDAIARESGISKGGVLHQFRTKEAVLKALMEHQIERGDIFFREYLAGLPATEKEPILEAQIATLQIAADHPKSTTFGLIGAFAENPELIAAMRDNERQRVDAMKEQASNSKIALVRWSAAKGLALASLLGLCPLSDEERAGLFAFIKDDTQWCAISRKMPAEARPEPSAPTKRSAVKSGAKKSAA